ncbi:hypothetical protein C8J57DRAFT_1715236 [Mycena rebaudengoi]|nr:hypothetical protein C8J57DRAFT_1715236 [Mycena rebaudengoi]
MALSLGPNALFMAHAVSGGECAGAPAGMAARWRHSAKSEGAALTAEVRQRRDVAYEDALVMLVTKATDLEEPLRVGEGLVAEQGSKWFPRWGRGALLMDGYKSSGAGSGRVLDERITVFEDPQDEYLPAVERRRSVQNQTDGAHSSSRPGLIGGESELDDYVVDVFLDVLLTAGFRGGHELLVVAAHTVNNPRSERGHGRRVQTLERGTGLK